MRLFAFKRADIEGIRSERVDQRRIVDLGGMGERDQRGAAIDADLGKRLVWPLARNLYVAKTVLGCEGGTRIHDYTS